MTLRTLFHGIFPIACVAAVWVLVAYTLSFDPAKPKTNHGSTIAGTATALGETREGHYHSRPRSRVAREILTRDASAPWSVPGQCSTDGARGDRAAYLSRFVAIPEKPDTAVANHVHIGPLMVAPGLPTETAVQTETIVRRTHGFIVEYFAPDMNPPIVYLHSSAEELRQHACLTSNAVAYYDGSVHVAPITPDAELERSIRHEFAHHLLRHLGFGRPLWLQEGFAVRFALDPLNVSPEQRDNAPITLDDMVAPVSVESTAQAVTLLYAQAAEMFDFLNGLPPVGNGRRGYAGLLDELRQGVATDNVAPQDLFVWAMKQRGGDIIDGDPVRFWENYWRTGRFSPEVARRIREASVSRH